MSFYSIVNHHPEIQQWAIGVAGCEAMGEAALQSVLQLYIMLSQEEREPSQLQLLSILTSALIIGLPDIQTLNSLKPRTTSLAVDLGRILIYIPLYFFTVIFRVTTFALILVFIRWYFIFYYLGLALLMRALVAIWVYTTETELRRRETLQKNIYSAFFLLMSLTTNMSNIRDSNEVAEEPKICYRLRKTKMTEWNIVQELWFSAFTIHYVEDDKISRAWRKFHIVFWLCTNTVALLAILAVSNTTDLLLPGLNIRWSNLLLVQKIYFLNIVIPSTILCGLVSTILCWQQFNM